MDPGGVKLNPGGHSGSWGGTLDPGGANGEAKLEADWANLDPRPVHCQDCSHRGLCSKVGATGTSGNEVDKQVSTDMRVVLAYLWPTSGLPAHWPP